MIQPVLQPQEPPKRVVLTVTQLNRQAKTCLEIELGSIWLTGEISNLTRAASGHWYFSLKDDSAQIRCAMFRFKAQTLRFSPSEGDQVIVKGKVSLYEARGDYQLIADYMEPAGEGVLQQKLKQLITDLQAQGLFSQENKLALPRFPKRIGVITSPTGAAIHDVLTVLSRRCPMIPVIIYPTQVQGASATNAIINAIDIAEKRNECDVLLITRGGGSLEDLWCFNDEKLAYRLAELKIPTVAAIGHEVDLTIAELVADLRAATPSAAAELLSPEQDSLIQRVDQLSLRLFQLVRLKLETLVNRLNLAKLKLADPSTTIESSQLKLNNLTQQLKFSLSETHHSKQKALDSLSVKLNRNNPSLKLGEHQNRLENLKLKLNQSMSNSINKQLHRFQLKASALETLSPLKTLSRGFSIVRDEKNKSVVSSISQLSQQQELEIILVDGKATARVTGIKNS
ncbi:exodeoxyribonuclease VII large subunit [Aliikangiella sp. G2MR2-5]|uniref:exodeoxyribonuclease VII large subunit n=1 Tax=Aliikangiella sp. G2MR2-5 TaxID=2788943 RepID=UPI0018AA03B3|nr:exodeoxyribonuclease VII large subunit [Aliikangiella sp. G2MR2-5]